MTNPTHAPKAEDRLHEEKELDDALENSFPASDPPAMTTPSSITGTEVAPAGTSAEDQRKSRADIERKLDRELEQTFPASDTPGLIRKHSRDDA